jgi:hypothetical protein
MKRLYSLQISLSLTAYLRRVLQIKKVRSLNRLIPLAPSMRVLVTSDRHRVPLSRIKAIFEVRNHYIPRLANSHKSRYTLVEDCRNNVRVPLITVKI